MASFFTELKRRNVFRVGVAYAVLGWLVIQITDTVAPALRLPEWTLGLVTWLGAVGFPFALLFAWAFELTPEGIRRSTDVAPEESVTRETGKRLTQVTIILMGATIALLLLERSGLFSEIIPTEEEITSAPSQPEIQSLDSIAVLPFINMSDDIENQYFGDGLAEELLNQLAGIPELRVAARTSSFYFRDKDPTIAEVAQALDVAAVLEGSVQRSGNTIRVVAQLIRASDSAHLWSAKYDRPLDDYFSVQDDIANHIIRALQPHLDTGRPLLASSEKSRISPELFERYLWARRRFYDRTTASRQESLDAFQEITRAAPDYAPAWAWLARAWLATASNNFGNTTPANVAEKNARTAIDEALRLDPNEALAYLAEGMLEWSSGGDLAAEEKALRKALELDPLLVDAMIQLQHSLAYSGRAQEAIALLERARRIDPLHPQVLTSLAHLYNLKGDMPQAFAALEKLYAISPQSAWERELHLYADRNLMARLINLQELMAREHPDKVQDEGPWFSLFYMYHGLYDHPGIRGQVYEPLSLAVRGESERAEQLLREIAPGTLEHPIEMQSYCLAQMALGNQELARTVLWDRWLAVERSFGPRFFEQQGILLVSLLQSAGQTAEADSVLAVLADEISKMSSMHQGSLAWLQAMHATLGGDRGLAIELFRELAETGYTGDRKLGEVEALAGPLRDDPRFIEILEIMERNYAAQLIELERLRNSGMNASQLRADFLARSQAGAGI